jgi:hypothetical protein
MMFTGLCNRGCPAAHALRLAMSVPQHLHRTDRYDRRERFEPVGPIKRSQDFNERIDARPFAGFEVLQCIERDTRAYRQRSLINVLEQAKLAQSGPKALLQFMTGGGEVHIRMVLFSLKLVYNSMYFMNLNKTI